VAPDTGRCNREPPRVKPIVGPLHGGQHRRFRSEDNNDFALAMYGTLRQRPDNLFFSPFSIRTALGVTQAGARGETVQRLNAAGGGDDEMAVANALWGQEQRRDPVSRTHGRSDAGRLKRGRDAVGRHRGPGCRRPCYHRPVDSTPGLRHTGSGRTPRGGLNTRPEITPSNLNRVVPA